MLILSMAGSPCSGAPWRTSSAGLRGLAKTPQPWPSRPLTSSSLVEGRTLAAQGGGGAADTEQHRYII